MEPPEHTPRSRMIFVLQLVSLSLIWIFVIGIAIWIGNLLRLSIELRDAVGATASISLLAIPVFVLLASVLTYVFVGLQRKDRTRPSTEGGKTLPVVTALAMLGSIASGTVEARQIEDQSEILAGRIVFEEKGCVTCHSVGGFGGTTAPDLSTVRSFRSLLDLASDFWNHAPQMLREYRRIRREPPFLSEKETLELASFLYSFRYLGEPGSVSRGRALLESKGCVRCHPVAGRGGSVAQDLAGLRQYASPLYMAQTMWNHLQDMLTETVASHEQYPTLTGVDLVDMAAYLRAGFAGGVALRMTPGDRSEGERVFRSKGCAECHGLAGTSGKVGPDLSVSAAGRSVTEIAAAMWNHGPRMSDRMKRQGLAWPNFEGNEIADLIAFVYFLGFVDAPGDASAGNTLLTERGCRSCHQGDGVPARFEHLPKLESSIELVQLMWNHAPRMEERALIRNLAWPTLTQKEMQDIYAYLRVGRDDE